MSELVDKLLHSDNNSAALDNTQVANDNNDHITTEPKTSVWVCNDWFQYCQKRGMVNRQKIDTVSSQVKDMKWAFGETAHNEAAGKLSDPARSAAAGKYSNASIAGAVLLKCDYFRANIEPYNPSRLLDNHQGHWELCEDGSDKKDMVEVQLGKDNVLFSRPPILDVKWGAVCAIDFGTKSTVVVCRDENNDERMLRVGKGNYTEVPTLRDYENPTVIELVNKNAFMEAYNKRTGRPFTNWCDLTVSHQAAETIEANEESASLFDSVFSDLKQWAQAEDSALWISDQQGESFKLPPYKELKEDSFDPIEIYAYYLGLYINNMTQGIYLDYIMSYPVTYTPEVRERICRSFYHGLWKSLPAQLQGNKRVQERFRVYPGASEPAAYAASALKAFGLQPKKGSDDEVAYAVFDFGGGTTDFDFGVMRCGKRTFFEIEQYGAGGDSHLGGENLLEMLAYDAYKENFEIFRKMGVRFVLPPEGEVFAGSESFVLKPNSASRYAYLNNKYLSKAMRPIWENADFKGSLQSLKGMALFCERSGKSKFEPLWGADKIKINIGNEMLEHLSERIEEGVRNFFAEMEQAFAGREIYPIHIFLAGNSCRSPLVQALFEDYIGKYKEKIGQNNTCNDVCILHYPLGWKNNSGSVADSTDKIDQCRTGKTGVAFGLLRMRKGERDIRVIERRLMDSDGNQLLPFRYYLGRPDQDSCFEVSIDKKVPYGQWKWFTYADENEFYLYFTEQSKAVEGGMSLTEVQSIYCTFNEEETSISDDIGVYICKKTTDEIMYVVGSEVEALDGKFKNQIYTVKLKED